MKLEIRSLNEHEKDSIRKALSEYISLHGEKGAWLQQIIRDEMLDRLMWVSKDGTE